MKKLIYFLAIICVAGSHTYAQTTPFADGVKTNALPIVYLPVNVSVQFVSPELIQYVDISSNAIIGDLPLKNVLRIRLKDSVKSASAVLTIAGEKFIAQYRIVMADSITMRDSRTEIPIDPAITKPLDISGIGLSQPQLKNIALDLFCKNPEKPIAHTKAFGMIAMLYHLYTAGDYVFIDLGYRNKTNLTYNIEDFRFHIDDRKITKATNIQSVELHPEFMLYNTSLFQKTYRNVIVLKKVTFPGNKILHIELSEKQHSGRVITLNITYQDVLDADIIPL